MNIVSANEIKKHGVTVIEKLIKDVCPDKKSVMGYVK